MLITLFYHIHITPSSQNRNKKQQSFSNTGCEQKNEPPPSPLQFSPFFFLSQLPPPRRPLNRRLRSVFLWAAHTFSEPFHEALHALHS